MRNISASTQIDVTKGLLVVAMVLAHTIQRFELHSFDSVSYSINLLCFSGFMYCFGYAAWIAYLSKDATPWRKVLITSAKCYVAFIIAGSISSMMLNNNGVDVIYRIALMQTLPPYAEFFLTFSMVILISSLLKPVLTKATQSNALTILSCLLCLLTTFITPWDTNIFIGQLIGGTNYYYFPLIQYLPLFILGVYSARNDGKFNILALLMSLPAFYYLITTPNEIGRFPPSYEWIASSVVAVYMCHKISWLICGFFRDVVIHYISSVGRNTIIYLILSNAVLFALEKSGYKGADYATVIVTYAAIMAMIYFVISTSKNNIRTLQK